ENQVLGRSEQFRPDTSRRPDFLLHLARPGTSGCVDRSHRRVAETRWANSTVDDGRRMSEAVLVTGGFGLVGWETVKRLAADGRPVVRPDLDIPPNTKRPRAPPPGAKTRGAALTNMAEGDRLLSEGPPTAIAPLAPLTAPP